MNKSPRVDSLFLALLVVQVALFWSVRFLPSQDGTSHLANAHVLLNYGSPNDGMFPKYYAINARLEPNLLSHVLLVALMALVPAIVAQKILVSGYVILLALARYAIRAVSAKNDFLAVLIFPLVGNLMLQKGFYNFSYSLAVYLWFVGYWLRGKRSPATILGLSLLLYLCHPVSLIVALATAGACSIVEALRDRAVLRHLLPPWLAMLPAVALMVYFFVAQAHGAGPISGEIHSASLSGKWILDHLQLLLTLDVLYSYRPYEEVWLARAYAMLLGIILMLGLTFSPSPCTQGEGRGEGSDLAEPTIANHTKRRTLTLTLSLGTGRGNQMALWFALTFTVLAYFLAPNESAGGSFITLRLSLYPWLLLLLILAGWEYGRGARLGIRIAGTLLALGMIASQLLAYRAVQPYLADYVSAAGHIERGATIVSAVPERPLRNISPRVHCILTATGYLDEERDLVDLYNYEAIMGYFPLVYRPEMNPAQYFDDSHDDVAGYQAATHGRVDYILLWREPGRAMPLSLPMLQPVLDADYQLVYTSPMGYLLLYRHK